MKLLLTIIVLLSGSLAQDYGQQSATQSGTPKDPFMGTWVLDAGKSTLPPTDSRVTIESSGTKYKVTLFFRGKEGPGFTSWTVTDMKGKRSKVKRSFSRTDEEWRVTRKDENTFLLETFSDTEQYTVSADGKTLTLRILDSKIISYSGPTNPVEDSVKTVVSPNPVLVYNKKDE